MSYFVGIDIAKNKHDCFIVTGDGEVIRNSFTFPNNDEGFQILKVTLDQLDHSQKIKIGLEATGHYGKNLKQFLTSIGYEFSELNPYLVKKFIQSITLRRTKTDKVDAQMIAKFIQAEASKPTVPLSYNILELRTLVRNHDKLIRSRSDELVKITNSLDRIFPELKKFLDNHLGEFALYLLEHYTTPEKILKLTNTQIQKLHNIGRRISVSKIILLKELASKTVGHPSLADELVIKQSIKMIRVINDSIKIYESQIKEIMKEIKSPLLSIPGIGMMTAAALHAEFGDFRRFSSPAKLLSFAGLECSKNQSGQSDFKGHMVKHGSSYLRYVLMNAAISLKNHCPAFSAYFHKKFVEENKHYRVALNHVVRKFLRVAFKLVTLNENYNLDLSK
ncbi:MAG: IS110 family transposase [Erysipelotrichaceae bacterium]|nr:IS110 family transposase [Erysipelotrichaceae bacterium]